MAGEDYSGKGNIDPAFPPWKIRDVGAIMIVCHAVVFGYRKLLESLLFTDLKIGVAGFSVQKLESFLVWTIFSQGILLYGLLLWLSARLIRRHGYSFAAIGWHCNFPRIWWLWSCVIGAVFGFVYFFSIRWILGGLPPGWKYTGYVGEPVGYWVPFFAFYLVVFCPVEEVFFRGVNYNVFRKHVGVPAGIILSSLVFVIWHPLIIETPIMAAYILVCGLIECTVFERLKSLVPAVLVHIMINLTILFSSQYL